MKRQQSGFTLIELIIVIVILGILAITAAPRFFNFGSDARASTLNGLKAALESASSLTYSKAIIKGVQDIASGSTVDINTATSVSVVYGYPASTEDALRTVAELSNLDWDIVPGTGVNLPAFGAVATGSLVISVKDSTLGTTEPTSCHVIYRQSQGINTKPEITVYSAGC